MIKFLKSLFSFRPGKSHLEEKTFEVDDLIMSVDVYFVGRAKLTFHIINSGYGHRAGDYLCGKSIIKFRSKDMVVPFSNEPFKEPWRYALIPNDIKVELIGGGYKKGSIPIQAFEVEGLTLMPASCSPEMYPSSSIIPNFKFERNDY